MKRIIFIVGMLLFLEMNTAYSELPRCEERLTCVIPNLCQCTVTPSTLDRFFYVDFKTLKRGTTYTCTFKSHPSIYVLILEGSKFPEGSTHECLDSCPQFPARLIVHTDEMKLAESPMEIKYFVSGFTDIPSDVAVECHF